MDTQAKIKVGDLVLYKPEFAAEGVLCLIVNTLAGDNYYDALAPNGTVLFLNGKWCEVINESR